MINPRHLLAPLVAALLLFGLGAADAQTTSARSESLEVSRRADELRAAGQPARATSLYRRAIEIDDTNERAYVGWSAALEALGRHEDALVMLDGARARMGWTADLGLARGVHLSRLERWSEALAELERVAAAIPDSFDAAYYLAGARLANRKWTEAVSAYDVYLARRPESLAKQDDAVKIRRAYARIGAGVPDRARRELEQVLARRPESRAARAMLFVALARSGACKRALALVPRGDAIAMSSPTVRYDRAVCQLRTGKPRAARDTLEAIARAGELPREALILRGAIYEALDNDGGAIASYRRALTAGLAAELHLARVLARRGEHAEVARVLLPRFEAGTATADELAVLATSLLAAGDRERALAATDRLVERRGGAADLELHAEVLLELGRWSDAEAAANRAFDAAPDDARAHDVLRRALEARATVAFRAGDTASATARLTRALEVDPAAHDAAYNLALLELAAGHPDDALARVRSHVDQLSSPARGRLLVARAELALGRHEAASLALEAVVADRDAEKRVRAQALSSLAQLVARSSPDRAVKLIARARSLATDDATLAAAIDRADAEARLAQAERAYQRGAWKSLRTSLAGVDAAHLPPAARTPAAVLGPFARAQNRGLRAGLVAAAALSDADLAGAALPPAAMRHAIALHLGMAFIRRTSDYNRLRPHAVALHKLATRHAAVRDLLTGWYDFMLGWARDRGASGLARAVAGTAPPALRTPAFELNAIVSAASARKPLSLTASERARLTELAANLPEARIDLAIDADGRGNDGDALAELRAIPETRRTPAVRTWLRWKELVHGAP